MATDPAPLEPTDEYDVIDPDMSCEDANRFSVRTVERLGYEVTAFTPASDDTQGVIAGEADGPLGRRGGRVRHHRLRSERRPYRHSLRCDPM